MNRKLTGKGLRVRDRMIQETARIIREQGFKQATVRAISERAGVNIASIRYSFGSKDELIGAAIDYLMDNFENIVHYLEKGDVAPEDRLFSFMRNYFRLANIHPALYRSISYSPTEDHQNTYFIYTNLLHDRCWDPILRTISEYTGVRDQALLQIKTLQLFASLEYPLILHSNRSEGPGLAYIYPNHLDDYIRVLIASLKTVQNISAGKK